MPKRHANTRRWGGPGASHEDATKPIPDDSPSHPEGAVATNPRVSQVSGGGGERDEKHSHVDDMRHSKSHATDGPSPTTSRAWRKNRSRRDRARDAEADSGSIDAMDGAPEAAQSDGESDGTSYLVQLNTADWKGVSDSLAAQVEQSLRSALRPVAARVTRVEVHVAEVAGATNAPDNIACAIEVRLAGRRPMTAKAEGSLDVAVRSAARKLRRNVLARVSRETRGRKGGDSVRKDAAMIR